MSTFCLRYFNSDFSIVKVVKCFILSDISEKICCRCNCFLKEPSFCNENASFYLERSIHSKYLQIESTIRFNKRNCLGRY